MVRTAPPRRPRLATIGHEAISVGEAMVTTARAEDDEEEEEADEAWDAAPEARRGPGSPRARMVVKVQAPAADMD